MPTRSRGHGTRSDRRCPRAERNPRLTPLGSPATTDGRDRLVPLEEHRMIRSMTVLVAAAFVFALGMSTAPPARADELGDQFAHMVFFTLKDSSSASKQKLVAACRK